MARVKCALDTECSSTDDFSRPWSLASSALFYFITYLAVMRTEPGPQWCWAGALPLSYTPKPELLF